VAATRNIADAITQSSSSFRIVTSVTRSSSVDSPFEFVDESFAVSVTVALSWSSASAIVMSTNSTFTPPGGG
jgi:hypothetical protein